MSILSTLMTKPLIMGIIALGGLSLALGGYSWYTNYKNEKLQEKLTLTQQTLTNLTNAVAKERQIYTTTLNSLQKREIEVAVKGREANELRARLRDVLQNEADECLSTPIDGRILELLQPIPEGNSGDLRTDNNTRAATTGL